MRENKRVTGNCIKATALVTATALVMSIPAYSCKSAEIISVEAGIMASSGKAKRVRKIDIREENNTSYGLETYHTDSTKSTGVDISESDAVMLSKMAMAEASGEGAVGKELVMRVILNRVKSNAFPNTVREVIYQSGQFSTIRNGMYDKAVPDGECSIALENIRTGTDTSSGATYFERKMSKSTWHSRNLYHIFDCGNHSFYREKE